jgi:hypothetical protein
MIRIGTIAAFAAAAALLTAPALANPTVVADSMSHGGMMMKSSCPPPPRFGGENYCNNPKLTNTLSLIEAGGGGGSAPFSTVKAFGVLAGPVAAPEEAKLIKQFGKPAFGQYIKTFDFVIADSLKIVTAAKVPLPKAPSPSPTDGKALSAALYTDGISKDGAFSVEYMLDHLVTHPVHVQVMKDIDAKYGVPADAAYHVVTLQIFKDLKAAYKL